MSRIILCVLDSVGCGGAPDAAAFGDEGANTLGHIALACATDRAEEGRSGPLHMPNLERLGLGAAIRLASGIELPGFETVPQGFWGAVTEVSMGKDTPSGHWELTGVPVPWDWHYFPNTKPAFPPDLIAEFCKRAKLPGILGDCHAPGIPIVEELGAESVLSGKPICYTSADSVFQIAAHEGAFGLQRLYQICVIGAELMHPMRVGRVIARPFLGDEASGFKRTPNRRDFAMTPPEPTLCERVISAGGRTHAVGKIGDIFAHKGISQVYKGKNDMELVDKTIGLLETAAAGDFIFANFVEFDTLYGHPRDVSGYARHLEAFDKRVPELLARLRPGDLIGFTADHGNDPTWRGTDHTRERVPVLMTGAVAAGSFGLRGFADVGETLAAHLGIPAGKHGKSFLRGEHE